MLDSSPVTQRCDEQLRERIKELAVSRGGLVNNDIRQRAWPALLGVDISSIPEKPGDLKFRIPY